LKEEHGGEEQFYSNTGFTKADDSRIRRKVAATIAVDKLLEEEIGPDPEVGDDDLKAFYDENIDQFMSEEEVRVSQIFMEPKSHEQAKECYQALRKTRDRVLDGEDFESVANEVGDKKGEEIDLGFFKQGDTMPEIEALTFSMRDGEISPIVATHFGFHIFKVTGRKSPEPVPFEQIKDQLKEPFLNRRREGMMKELVDRLKAASTIEEVTEEEEEALSH
jgi:parvulin-like peptidyl-prolyl isomerase